MRNLVVDKSHDNQKLSKYLLDSFSALKTSTIYKALRQKDIIVNGNRITQDIVVHYNDKVTIYIVDKFLSLDVKSLIVYEDDNIILINKPIGVEVTGDNSLTSELKLQISLLIEPCHRLDRNTTGLVLFAKNSVSLEILLDKFKRREIKKHYACVVYGIPSQKCNTLKAYLFKDAKNSKVLVSDIQKESYKEIITSYNIISSDISKNISVLDINLETGRTHQIRAHLAHIGYPIIGDGKYGQNSINKKFNVKYQLLCSYKIKFEFTTSTTLDYLNNKEFKIPYNFKI